MDCKNQKLDSSRKIRKPWPKNQFELQSKLNYQSEVSTSSNSFKTFVVTDLQESGKKVRII